jgi:hypothetical protein
MVLNYLLVRCEVLKMGSLVDLRLLMDQVKLEMMRRSGPSLYRCTGHTSCILPVYTILTAYNLFLKLFEASKSISKMGRGETNAKVWISAGF